VVNARRALRYGSWLLALFVVLSATAVAVAAGVSAQGAVILGAALATAAIIVLLAHQPFGRPSLLTLLLLVAAFVAPVLLVHDTVDTSGCNALDRTPCEGRMIGHPVLQLAIFSTLLGAALVSASAGYIRRRRG